MQYRFYLFTLISFFSLVFPIKASCGQLKHYNANNYKNSYRNKTHESKYYKQYYQLKDNKKKVNNEAINSNNKVLQPKGKFSEGDSGGSQKIYYNKKYHNKYVGCYRKRQPVSNKLSNQTAINHNDESSQLNSESSQEDSDDNGRCFRPRYIKMDENYNAQVKRLQQKEFNHNHTINYTENEHLYKKKKKINYWHNLWLQKNKLSEEPIDSLEPNPYGKFYVEKNNKSDKSDDNIKKFYNDLAKILPHFTAKIANKIKDVGKKSSDLKYYYILKMLQNLAMLGDHKKIDDKYYLPIQVNKKTFYIVCKNRNLNEKSQTKLKNFKIPSINHVKGEVEYAELLLAV